MKRKALLVGNTGGLRGVSLDLQRMAEFLKSPCGGSWFDSEIEIHTNPEKSDIYSCLMRIKASLPDYVTFMFSGHGAHEGQTILQLNNSGETIEESVFRNLAPRQLSVFDCCRAVSEPIHKSTVALDALSFRESYDYIRERYGARIMQAIPQQVRLYGCAKGQSSYDTSNGAVYLTNLLSCARNVDAATGFKTVECAHMEAREKTIEQIKNNPDFDGPQTPEAHLPKCIINQQLIISIK